MTPEAVVAAVLAGAAGALLSRPSARRVPAPSRGAVRGPGHDPPGWLMPVAGGVSLGVAAALLVGTAAAVWVGVATGVAGWAALRRLEQPAQRRRRERLAADLPHAVDLLAACLTAGQPPTASLASVIAALEEGPLREELRTVLARLRLGADPVPVWRQLARDPQLSPLGRSLARAVDSGASVADAMGRLADDLRRDRRADVEARARAVGVRCAVPLGVCMLPAFVLVGVVPLVVTSLGSLVQR